MLQDFISLLYPRLCALCEEGLAKNETHICLQCLHQLPRYSQEHGQDEISRHFIHSYRYEAFYAYLKYFKKGITQKLLHQIKYNHMPVLAEKIGYMLGLEIKGYPEIHSPIELIIPIPLHQKKRKIRGYNQSDFFARGIAGALGIPWSNREIKRIKNTDTQTNKSRLERIENVTGIFNVLHPKRLQGNHILLVDDVITTGATLESCSETILQVCECTLSLAAMAVAQ